jgi:hypothetical protein
LRNQARLVVRRRKDALHAAGCRLLEHAGHVDVRQDDDQLGPDPVRQLIEPLLAGGREMQDLGALPRLAAKALAKHLGDVGSPAPQRAVLLETSRVR